MRIVCWFAMALALIGLTFAQTGFKNTTNDWSMISNVSGSRGELLGKVYAAPNSTLTLDGNSITGGAGKFVSEKGQKETVACSVYTDSVVDFVALEVSLLSWNTFGEPLEMSLARPVVSYHLKADKSNNFVDVPLLASGTDPGYSIVKKADATMLNELAGKTERTANLIISFPTKERENGAPTHLGMFLSFNSCRLATPDLCGAQQVQVGMLEQWVSYDRQNLKGTLATNEAKLFRAKSALAQCRSAKTRK
jgi:hypothetical protein